MIVVYRVEEESFKVEDQRLLLDGFISPVLGQV